MALDFARLRAGFLASITPVMALSRIFAAAGSSASIAFPGAFQFNVRHDMQLK